MAQRLFGTDGIRGEVGNYPLTEEMIFKLGQAVGLWLNQRRVQSYRKILIAKDTRKSGNNFEQAISAGLISTGVEVSCIGIMPTPAVAYFVRQQNYDVGIVISASHNAAGENGIKFFNHEGFKLYEDDERKIEEIIQTIPEDKPFTKDIALQNENLNFRSEYIEFLRQSADGLNLKGKTIVIDCAQGAVTYVGKEVFEKLGAKVISINDNPNGNNVNLNSGALYPEVAARSVLKMKADVGFSFDGDGDRVIAIDEKGNILDGDFIIAILAKNLLQKNRLLNKSIVCTHMSNGGLDLGLKAIGIKVFRTDVGDRFVLKEMLDKRIVLGGEQSGHIIFLDYTTTADSLITALQILKVMIEEEESLSALSTCMRKIPQIVVNVKVETKLPFDSIPGVRDMVKEYKERLSPKGGRIMLRYSGTESVARIMIEGNQKEEITQMAQTLAKKIEEEIGVGDESR
jgi:phosphoglucosamine mutase